MKNIFALFCLGLLLLAGACAQPEKTELRFLFWGDLAEIDAMIELIASFEKGHPAIKVKLEHFPVTKNYIHESLTYFKHAAAPDVMFVEVNNYVIFRHNGMLLDLSALLAKDAEFSLQDYYPDVIKRFSVGDNLYAIPRDTAPICCVYYNKDLFDAAGVPYPREDWQWPQDFLPIAQSLTQYKAQGETEVYGFVDDWPNWDAFVLSNGGSYVDNSQYPGRITLDSPESIAAIRFRRDLVYKYKVTPSPAQLAAASVVDSTDLFTNQRAAMFLSGLWKTPYFREINDFAWDMVLFPKGPTGLRRFSTGGSGYAIVKSTAHPQQAWQLIKFLAGRPGQEALARSGVAQPANRTIAQSALFLDGRRPHNKHLLLEAVAHTEYTPNFIWWSEFQDAYLFPALNQIWDGEPGIEELLRDVTERANRDFFH